MEFDEESISSNRDFHLSELSKFIRAYERPLPGLAHNKVLHLKSSHLHLLSNLLNEESSLNPIELQSEYFELLCEKIKRLKNLRINFNHEKTVDLQLFSSLEQLRIDGPYSSNIKGLRLISSRLRSFIIESASVTLNQVLSKCLADESGPMSWPCLVALQISHCNLEELDASLKLLPNLQELDLSFNNLKTMGENLGYLEKLTHLNISFNKINSMPQLRYSSRWRLRSLFLAHNEVTSLEGAHALEGLCEFDLSHNLLTQHSELLPLRHLLRLKDLNLAGNPLCHSAKHRLFTMQSLSPASVNPEFLLDGELLSKKELKAIMYTPTAISIPTNVRPTLPSINPNGDRYDVSMSIASSPFQHDSYDIYHRGSVKQSRRSGKAIANISSMSHPPPSHHQDPEPRERSETGSTLADNESYRSISSSVSPSLGFATNSQDLTVVSPLVRENSDENDGRASRISSNSKSPVSCLDGDSVQVSNSDDYFSPEDDPSVYQAQSGASSPRAGSFITNGSENGLVTPTSDKKMEDEIGINQKFNLEDSVTPPLHVRRSISNESLDGPSEVFLAANRSHLVEHDINSGKAWEELELSAVNEVVLKEVHKTLVLKVKFSYLRKDRRKRTYTVLDVGAQQAVSMLYRELERSALNNRNRQFVCLKCSAHFTADPTVSQNSFLDSYSLQTATVSPGSIYGLSQYAANHPQGGIACACGSDMVVLSDSQAMGDTHPVREDDCAEATESSIIRLRSLSRRSNSVNALGVSENTHTNEAWMDSLPSATDVNHSLAPINPISQMSNDPYLSGSLPSDLNTVSIRSAHTTMEGMPKTASLAEVNFSNHPASSFKTFSHLLTAHDLYKLVDVTPSLIMRASVNENSANESLNSVAPSNHLKSLSKNPSQAVPANCLTTSRQLVTSTPRRRPNNLQLKSAAFSVDSSAKPIDSGIFMISRPSKRRRALNFDPSGPPISGSSSEDASTTNRQRDSSLTEEKCGASDEGIDPKLQHFIEEELLEPSEEIRECIHARLLKITVKDLGVLAADEEANTRLESPSSTTRKTLFGTSRKSSLRNAPMDLLELVENNESDALLLLTTENMQILKVSDRSKPLTSDNLECMASHPLDHIVTLELGLSSLVLYFVVAQHKGGASFDMGKSPSSLGRFSSKKNKFTLDFLDVAYSIYFSKSEECEKFYHSFVESCSVKHRLESLLSPSSNISSPASSASSGISRSQQRRNTSMDVMGSAQRFSVFSDVLEKNFSEHVLMNLDLNIPERLSALRNQKFLLMDKLYKYFDCWVLDETFGKEVQGAFVVSCGGSFALVNVQRFSILHELTTALVMAKGAQKKRERMRSGSMSFLQNSPLGQGDKPASVGLITPHFSTSFANSVYSIRNMRPCSDLDQITQFQDHVTCLELTFASMGEKGKETWQLTLSSSSMFTEVLELVKSYASLKDEELEVTWK